MKNVITLFFLSFCIVSITFAQEDTATLIEGLIVTPVGEQLEDIHIYDTTTHKGTLTNEEGEFQIFVNENDELQITSMQFESFNIQVSASMIAAKRMTIFINQKVNELDEVVLKAYDLSGNVSVDVVKINVFDGFNDLDLSYKTLEFDYAFTPDAQSSTRGNTAKNALLNDQSLEGADLIGGVTLLSKLVFGKEKKESIKTQEQLKSIEVYQTLKGKYTKEFMTTHYNIPEEKVSDFVIYMQEQGLPYAYLEPENELLLLGHMVEVSASYLKRNN